MKTTPTNETDRPYRVVLVGGKDSDMVAGYDEEEQAKARADKANAAAETLGLTAKYEVRKVK